MKLELVHATDLKREKKTGGIALASKECIRRSRIDEKWTYNEGKQGAAGIAADCCRAIHELKRCEAREARRGEASAQRGSKASEETEGKNATGR